MRYMRKSFNDSELLCIVPAAGRGTRLGRLTDQQAKPSVAVAFEPVNGDVTRMIDIPLAAIRQLGGVALVTTHYRAESLAFVENYNHVHSVGDNGFVTPIDSIAHNRPLIESSSASVIGIVPADARISSDTLAGMCNYMVDRGLVAAMLATEHLDGHNVRPVNVHNIAISSSANPRRYLADLGLHVFDKRWLLNRIDECSDNEGIDIWQDVYQIDNPVAEIGLYVPHHDNGLVDMGTPARLQQTIYELNADQVDANGNILFPNAKLFSGSTGVIALPNSTGLASFHNAIIPENMTAIVLNDVLEAIPNGTSEMDPQSA